MCVKYLYTFFYSVKGYNPASISNEKRNIKIYTIKNLNKNI